MGLIFGLALTTLVFKIIYDCISDKKAREKIFKEFKDDPTEFIAVFTWAACILICMWGVFIPAFGNISIGDFALWQLGGIGGLIGLVITPVWLQVKRKR